MSQPQTPAAGTALASTEAAMQAEAILALLKEREVDDTRIKWALEIAFLRGAKFAASIAIGIAKGN